MTNEEIIILKDELQAELIETHISWVLLTTDKAYKIKKPVEFSFLDFSDISLREEMCFRELELNRRLSNIYLGVNPICKAKRGIELRESCEDPIDYAVVMKRLPEKDRFDIRLESNDVHESEIHKLTKKLVDFHANCEVLKNADDPAFVEKRFRDVMQVQAWLRKTLGSEEADVLDRSMKFHERFIDEKYQLFDKRVKEGFKRDLHGDLHTQNIFLTGDVEIFDCIEFSPKYREIDVISEVAFLSMDLESYQRNDLSELFVDDYLSQTKAIRNEEEWRLFQYYKAYRANVKVKVLGLRAMNDPTLETEWLINRVRNYLRVLDGYIQN